MHKQLYGEFLIGKGIATQEEVNAALKVQKTQKRKLGEILLDMQVLSPESFRETLSEFLEVPVITGDDLPEEPPLMDRLNLTYLSDHNIFPLRFDEDEETLHLAMANPLDYATIDAVELSTGLTIEPYLIDSKSLKMGLELYAERTNSAMDDIVNEMDADDEGMELVTSDEFQDEKSLMDMASEAPIIRLCNLLITQAVKVGASDIHIEPFENELRVRYRIDGVLKAMDSPPKKMQAAVISRIKIMSELNIAERRLPQDGRIRLRIEGKKIDLRVSTTPTQHGESVVMRILDQSTSVKSLTSLGFPEDTMRRFEHLIYKPHGIILVTGPTGSGKTTTLYASLAKLNEPSRKIITVEDPVEYQLNGVNQIQVKPAIGLTFASGLRSIVRQDPDIILVGEIRDRETAEIAIQSSLTGHLVFSTLHTNDAPGAITRLTDMGVENFKVSSTLEGALAQRLVRNICPHCTVPDSPDPKVLRELELTDGFALDFTPYRGEGCIECNQTGYKGRSGIYELLIINDQLRSLILENATSSEIRKMGKRFGMRTLRDDAWKKVQEGRTTIEELLRVTQEEESTYELAS